MTFKIYYIFLLELVVFNQAVAQLPNKTYQQIQLLINEKNLRTPAQKKLDSRLLQFEWQQRGRAMVAGLTVDAIKLTTDSKGFIKVDIRAEVDKKLLDRIEALGGKIIFSSVLFHTITAEISPGIAEQLAAFPEIKFIEPTPLFSLAGMHPKAGNAPGVNNIPYPKSRTSGIQRKDRVRDLISHYLDRAPRAVNLFSGSVTSQGDKAHRAEEVRNVYGYAGKGVRIGVLSDSYNAMGGAAADIASGDLPGVGNPSGNTDPVTVLQDDESGADEGRAMLQIIHDLAPKAQLFFATAKGGPASFAANILALRNAPYNCDIIIDDIIYFNEPVFYDGIIAQAVNTVTAGGGLYFSAAGNEGSLLRNSSGVYEGDFNDTGSSLFTGIPTAGTIHNFGTVAIPETGDSITRQGAVYMLSWADPDAASTNDYDLFLVSSAGTIKAFSTNLQTGTQNPYESIGGRTLSPGDQLVVFKSSSAAVRALHLNTQGGLLKYATNGQTSGHSAAMDAYSVADTPAETPSTLGAQRGPFPGAFSSANKVETGSSDGPRRIFFKADGTPVTPGNFLFATKGGVVRNKPDITAADGVVTTFSDASGLNPFYGTSAAAPHAGAIAALLKSARPSITPAEMRAILTSTALDIEGTGYDNNSGYGILQAFQAMQLLSPTALATINLGTVSMIEGSFSNKNGAVDPGELGELTIQLTNPSLVDATAVSAVLTTSTPGIAVTQGVAAYGTASGGSNIVNAVPFQIAVHSDVACGTQINFMLTTTFAGGTGSNVSWFTITVGAQPFLVISDTIGRTPQAGIGYTVISGEQAGRILRSPVGSTCATPVANLGLAGSTRVRHYNAYTFSNTNSTSQCVTVTMTSPNGTNLHVVAYNDSGFVPSNPGTNYLAQGNASAITQTYSFTVGAGNLFTVVVHDVTGTVASDAAYHLNLSLSNCAVAPVCIPAEITPGIIPAGEIGSHYRQSFAAIGGSGSFRFTLLGNLPGGLSFLGDSLAGTPSQAGTFPIKIIATDLAGCPGDTSNYEVVITGSAPATITILQGTPQTVYPATVFPNSLKVLVLDTGNNALSGVNVIFTAPSLGASGSFTGGVKTVTLLTNADGIVTAPVFTANAVNGSYIVTAAVTGVPDAHFNLTNFCPANFVVTSNADSGAGSLREIINNVCAGVTISFDPSITSIVLTSGQLAINKALAINGPGASKLSISGNNNSRVFQIVPGGATVSLSGITIRDGNPPQGDFGGGGVLIVDTVPGGYVNISRCVITHNDVLRTGYPIGGGIYNAKGNVHIDRSAITNNTALFAGGIVHGLGAMVITNSTIAFNTTGAAGLAGGIYSASSLDIINSTIYGNVASIAGNIGMGADTVRLKNTIIAGGTLLDPGGTGPDLYGTGFISNDYNLIQDTSGATITGISAHNTIGINPLLLPLGNYGGETPSLLPQPISPVINAGDPAIIDTSDQRGFSRIVGGRIDIGAVEANYLLSSITGSAQLAKVLTPFPLSLSASVTESAKAISGATVIFSSPVNGAGGSFANGLKKDTAVTNLLGLASSHTFTANNVMGIYLDTATIGKAFPITTYSLTNTRAVPFTFLSVTAAVANCTVNLNWSIASENDNKSFTVEYSKDGSTYSALDTIPSQGNSSSVQAYTYRHVSTQAGVLYYRIRQTDINELFSFSNVVIVSSDCGRQPIVVYPNPVVNNLTIIIPGSDAHTLTVFNAIGNIIYRQAVQGGTFEISTSRWIKGAYILSITQKDRKAYSIKLIKE